MLGASNLVILPKVSEPSHVTNLGEATLRTEQDLRLEFSTTELVPNIELARGLIRTHPILKASPWITGALIASEDMAM
jgi:citrate lyase subunit beta/citryl-CoA lyase